MDTPALLTVVAHADFPALEELVSRIGMGAAVTLDMKGRPRIGILCPSGGGRGYTSSEPGNIYNETTRPVTIAVNSGYTTGLY